MGYDTRFEGHFLLSKKVGKEFYSYINAFNRTRHMYRDVSLIIENFPDWMERSYKGDLGLDGAYFICEDGKRTPDVIDYNKSTYGVPNLWCQWRLFSDKEKELLSGDVEEAEAYLAWDGGEKFYDSLEWLEYLIKHFFSKEGITLTGAALSVGEEFGDSTYICAVDNHTTTEYAYSPDAGKHVERWIRQNACDEKSAEKALSVFQDIFTSEGKLEEEWGEDDY